MKCIDGYIHVYIHTYDLETWSRLSTDRATSFPIYPEVLDPNIGGDVGASCRLISRCCSARRLGLPHAHMRRKPRRLALQRCVLHVAVAGSVAASQRLRASRHLGARVGFYTSPWLDRWLHPNDYEHRGIWARVLV